MTNAITRILHSPLIMSFIGASLAFAIMSSIASATAFRVDLPPYPGAQQIETSVDSEQSILTFVTDDPQEQVEEFFRGILGTDEWYYLSSGNQSQQICCYLHVEKRSYLGETNLTTSIRADYRVGIDFSTERENRIVQLTATKYKDSFYNINFDYSP